MRLGTRIFFCYLVIIRGLTRDWFEQSFEYYLWAVDFMRENQQLIESDIS